MIFMDLARVDDQGVLQFYAPWNAVEFVADPKKLEPDQRALEQVKYEPAKIGLGTTKRPAKIVLMRLTGRYDRLERNTIFEMPARSRSVASR